jgi:hypothetical protein
MQLIKIILLCIIGVPLLYIIFFMISHAVASGNDAVKNKNKNKNKKSE